MNEISDICQTSQKAREVNTISNVNHFRGARSAIGIYTILSGGGICEERTSKTTHYAKNA
jgi:hypothetical protein